MESLTLNPDAAAAIIAVRAKAALAAAGKRIAVGIAGGPGVGKSTIAAQLVQGLNIETTDIAALVPMDGFHMRHKKLVELGIAERKGAHDTFEGVAFAAFLMRARSAKRAVHGPGYSREIEDVVDDAYVIPAEARILVVEGNYLLLPDPPWDLVRPLIDVAVFLHLDRRKVGARLMKRHAEHGLFDEKRNRSHVARVDLPNYDLVEKTRARADIAIDLETRA
jgi:pantothenate kinase